MKCLGGGALSLKLFVAAVEPEGKSLKSEGFFFVMKWLGDGGLKESML